MPGIEDLLSPILGALGMGGSPSPVGGPPPPPNAGPQGAGGTPPPSASAAPAPQADSGFMTGLEHGLNNPMLQGAIASYLGTIGSPRREGWGRALAHGGLAGLGTFNQAEQNKAQMPMMAAQTAEAQARVPLMQSTAELQGIQTQQAKRGLQPISPEVLGQLDVMKSTATDPQAKGYFSVLESMGKSGQLSNQELATALKSFDEQKMLLEAAKTNAYNQMGPLMSGMFPGMIPPTAGPAAPGAPPPATSPASLDPSSGATKDEMVSSYMEIPGKGKVHTIEEDGKKYYLDGGKWTPIP